MAKPASEDHKELSGWAILSANAALEFELLQTGRFFEIPHLREILWRIKQLVRDSEFPEVLRRALTEALMSWGRPHPSSPIEMRKELVIISRRLGEICSDPVSAASQDQECNDLCSLCLLICFASHKRALKN